ncbi:DNA-binding response regulator [Longimonas halophila]|uniref:DNA-binding response regulator n=1 Tax=Longimonas halophila TaxID=1469170 RepID=A0A2H3P2G7_9BACT|nr:response regulator transcription factor [Longimonas halophila]PEN08362.1 DNA-binding response regulator [Longimonas halophila]
MDAHILLVEDEADIASFIQRGLTEEGYVVTWVTEGEQALDELRTSSVDVVLLDIRLPGISGMEVLHQVRDRLPHLPVMMLTALDAVEDRVAGLRSGADDYLPKPFDFDELLARVEALLRRAGSPDGDSDASDVLHAGALRLDRAAHTCICNDTALDLTPKEFDLLAYFMAHPGEALQRAQIHRDVWGHDFDRGTNLIDVYVAYVRNKLNETACCDACIETVRGVGYRFAPTSNASAS